MFTEKTILRGIDDSSNNVGGLAPEKMEYSDGTFQVTRRFVRWFSVSPISIHGLVAILTGISHFWSCYIRGPMNEGLGVKAERPNGWRWFEYSITATLMTVSAFVALGENNICTLFLVVIAGITIQFCGYRLEKGPRTIEGEWSIGCLLYTSDAADE